MSEAVIVALLVAIPPTITAIATLIVACRTNRDVGKVRRDVNGRVDQLVKATREAAQATGRQLERDSTASAQPQPPAPRPAP